MSSSDDKARRALTPRPGYEVGYAKPPAASQFQKGRSGNPKGRPKGSKNKLPALNAERLKQIVIEESYRGIPVRDGDRNVTISMAQAVVRSIAVNAAKGQHRAQRLFSELLAATETANKALSDEWLKTAIDYKVDWDRELDRRRQNGITHLPDPLPHPDHVIIDMNTGTAHVRGPVTKEQKAAWDEALAKRRMFEAEVESLMQELQETDEEEYRAFLQDEVLHTKNLIDIFDKYLPKDR